VDDKKPLLSPKREVEESETGNDRGRNSTQPPVKLTFKQEKSVKAAPVPPISVSMTSEELLTACEASCVDDGNVSTAVFVKDESCDVIEPPKPPGTALSEDELSPATSSVYINNAQVRKLLS